MTDHPDSNLERRFAERLRRDLEGGLPGLDPVDAARTARAVRVGHARRGLGWLLALAVTGLATVALIAINTIGNRPAVRPVSDRFWQLAAIQGQEAEYFDSMADMLAASDAVVIARPVSFKPGRVVGDSKYKVFLYFGDLTLQVDRVLKGAPGNSLTLEIEAVEPQVLDALSKTIPTDRAIYFLRNKGTQAREYGPTPGYTIADEARFWRLINSQGIYRDSGGRVASPLHADAGYAIHADGMPFEALVQAISSGEGLP